MLITLGISHKTAAIAIREQMAFTPEMLPSALASFAATFKTENVVLLSTCNRTELYSYCNHLPTQEQLLTWWQTQRTTLIEPSYFYYLENQTAVKHLMRLASGMESMMLGETQILSQLKQAMEIAKSTNLMGHILERLWQMSFAVAKRVRTQTQIGLYPISLAYLSVSLAQRIFTDLSTLTVLVIGAGENIRLVLQHLSHRTVKKIIIVNRTLEHAQELAQIYPAIVFEFKDLAQGLLQADIVFSAINTTNPLVTQTLFQQVMQGQKRRPILMIDLGLPRNIDSKLSLHEDIYLYSIDDLQHQLEENKKHRENAAIQAQSIVDEALKHYWDWLEHTQLGVVRHLRLHAEQIKKTALNQALRQLARGESPAIVLEQFAHQLMQKLLHEPTINLRKVLRDADQQKIKVAKELFNLE